MLVRMLTSRAGPTGTFAEGDTLDVPTDEARRMIATGQAEAAEPEHATANPAPENRIAPSHPPRRK